MSNPALLVALITGLAGGSYLATQWAEVVTVHTAEAAVSALIATGLVAAFVFTLAGVADGEWPTEPVTHHSTWRVCGDADSTCDLPELDPTPDTGGQ